MPTINIATPERWQPGQAPIAAPGLSVERFADQLDHPRWIYVLRNGDVLVTESNTPAEHECGSGVKGWFEALLMRLAGAGVKSADRITLLRDSRGGGPAEVHTGFLTGLKSPFGVALIGDQLYVANTDSIVRYPYKEGQLQITATGEKVQELPAGCINYHWTKNILASADGRKLYVTVGSNSDHGDRGAQAEEGRAAIYELDLGTGAWRPYASGIRNPNGLAFEPSSDSLWTVVNERDELGSDLVPDYMTRVKDGAFYGWPCYYYGNHVDTRVGPEFKCFGVATTSPDYALGTHTAPLGLAFARNDWPPAFRSGAFVAQHGSWNRRPWSGYKVIFVPFAAGMPKGAPIDVLWGFREGDAAHGRPVGLAFDKTDALLVSDDVGNVVWRVRPRN